MASNRPDAELFKETDDGLIVEDDEGIFVQVDKEDVVDHRNIENVDSGEDAVLVGGDSTRVQALDSQIEVVPRSSAVGERFGTESAEPTSSRLSNRIDTVDAGRTTRPSVGTIPRSNAASSASSASNVAIVRPNASSATGGAAAAAASSGANGHRGSADNGQSRDDKTSNGKKNGAEGTETTEQSLNSLFGRRSSQEENVENTTLMNSTRLRPGVRPSDGPAWIRTYINTYRSVFQCNTNCTSEIIKLAAHGSLSDSPFRSLCWRVLLNDLPGSCVDWVPSLESSRKNYEYLKKLHTSEGTNVQDKSLNVAINNPLSQDESSPWNKVFEINKVQKEIELDITRTWPEVDLLANEETQEVLTDILLVYAFAHPELMYRQGMNDLLGALYYVLYEDIRIYHQAVAISAQRVGDLSLRRDLDRCVARQIFSWDYLEHDAFALFEALMENLGDWFMVDPQPPMPAPPPPTKVEGKEDPKPWSKPVVKTAPPRCRLSRRILEIHDTLLVRLDPELRTRIDDLMISPTSYGIRYLRMLFGREFDFHDHLLILDAVFADSNPPTLAEEIMVALLLSLRDLIMLYDDSEATKLLFNIPANLDVRYVIRYAQHIKDPANFSMPKGSPFDNGTPSYRAESQGASAVQRSSSSVTARSSTLSPRKMTATRNTSRLESGQGRSNENESFLRRASSLRIGTRGRAPPPPPPDDPRTMRELLQFQAYLLTDVDDISGFQVVDFKGMSSDGQTRIGESGDNQDDPEAQGAVGGAEGLAAGPIEVTGREEVPTGVGSGADGSAAYNVTNAEYIEKVRLFKHIDNLKTLLKKENLTQSTKIFQNLTQLEETLKQVVFGCMEATQMEKMR